jgi:hypothetical protein
VAVAGWQWVGWQWQGGSGGTLDNHGLKAKSVSVVVNCHKK